MAWVVRRMPAELSSLGSCQQMIVQVKGLDFGGGRTGCAEKRLKSWVKMLAHTVAVSCGVARQLLSRQQGDETDNPDSNLGYDRRACLGISNYLVKQARNKEIPKTKLNCIGCPSC